MDLPDLLAWPNRTEVPGMVFRRLLSRQAVNGLDALSRPEQVLWLVFELCQEIVSGGPVQFFAHSSGDRAALVPAALRELSHPALASTVERCLRQMPAGRKPRAISAAARPHLEALELEVTAAHDALMKALADWFETHADTFGLTNAGLAAFRPVAVADGVTVPELLASALPPDELMPALYVRWVVGERSLSENERRLMSAVHAFGEISDEGGLSFLFCARAAQVDLARVALEDAGAVEASQIVGRVMGVLPAPFPKDTGARRDALAALGEDALTRLQASQWELDAVRGPTLEALANAARSLVLRS